MNEHPHSFVECCKHLTSLLLTGKLGDAWREDPECIKHCFKTIMIGLLDFLIPDTEPVIGSMESDSFAAVKDMVKAAGINQPSMSAEMSTAELQRIWLQLALQLIERLIEKWLAERY